METLTFENCGVITVPCQRLVDRYLWTSQHLELSDAAYRLLKAFIKKFGSKGESISDVLGSEFPNYKTLTHDASYTPAAVGYSQRQNFELALVSVYSDFTEFLEGVLKELFLTKPLLVAGKASKDSRLAYYEIIELGSWEAVTSKIVANAFRKLEQQRSTTKLLNDVLDGTDVDVSEPTKEAALAFLELRHLYVHNQGRADKDYLERYHHVIKCTEGRKVELTLKLVTNGLRSVELLARQISFELLGRGLAVPATQNMIQNHKDLMRQFGTQISGYSDEIEPEIDSPQIDPLEKLTWRAVIASQI
ncbi:MAG: hypothetical protein JST12_19880 [Armatimonadetes bacterium]|nr:hypothetical protein [Armatimonadota bacterium]